MSYSLPFRFLCRAGQPPALARTWKTSPLSKFPDRDKGFCARFEQTLPSTRWIQDPLARVAMTDLSPTGDGLMGRPVRARHRARLWNAYNAYTDLVDRSPYAPQSRSCAAVHNLARCMNSCWSVPAAFPRHHGATWDARLMHPPVRAEPQDLTRILVAPSLVRDACDFFSAFPRAKVAGSCTSRWGCILGRRAPFAAGERHCRSLLKRAAALQHARYVLWSDLTLAQIARRFGYADAAISHHEFRRATGGIPPSVYRAGRLIH